MDLHLKQMTKPHSLPGVWKCLLQVGGVQISSSSDMILNITNEVKILSRSFKPNLVYRLVSWNLWLSLLLPVSAKKNYLSSSVRKATMMERNIIGLYCTFKRKMNNIFLIEDWREIAIFFWQKLQLKVDFHSCFALHVYSTLLLMWGLTKNVD